MTYQLTPELEKWGATITPAVVQPGAAYWQIIEAQGPQNIGGNHHLFVDCWNEQGLRAVGLPVTFFSRDEEWVYATEPKKGERFAINLPMYAGGNAYGVKVSDGLPSDVFWGAGLGSFVAHHSFLVIFQKSIAQGTPPTPTPPAPPTLLTPALTASTNSTGSRTPWC